MPMTQHVDEYELDELRRERDEWKEQAEHYKEIAAGKETHIIHLLLEIKKLKASKQALVIRMPGKDRKCKDCLEYQPLSCGEHGDCNETGMIVPKECSCPSWNPHKKMDYLFEADHQTVAWYSETISSWNVAFHLLITFVMKGIPELPFWYDHK